MAANSNSFNILSPLTSTRNVSVTTNTNLYSNHNNNNNNNNNHHHNKMAQQSTTPLNYLDNLFQYNSQQLKRDSSSSMNYSKKTFGSMSTYMYSVSSTATTTTTTMMSMTTTNGTNQHLISTSSQASLYQVPSYQSSSSMNIFSTSQSPTTVATTTTTMTMMPKHSTTGGHFSPTHSPTYSSHSTQSSFPFSAIVARNCHRVNPTNYNQLQQQQQPQSNESIVSRSNSCNGNNSHINHHHHQHQHPHHHHQHHSNNSINVRKQSIHHYGSNRSNGNYNNNINCNGNNRTDILLDRKAFISLEKSINWQSLLNETSSSSSSRTLANNHQTNSINLNRPDSRKDDHSNNVSPPPSVPNQLTIDDAVNIEFSERNNPDAVVAPVSSSSLVSSSLSLLDNVNPSTITTTSTSAVTTTNTTTTTIDREFTLPGMKDVPAWLKLLRLHKYAPYFCRMSYEEMLDLTEDVLEHQNITKGARQKLILSIQKLKARSAVLLGSEHELIDVDCGRYRDHISYSSLSQVLFQIRAFLSTPIRPASFSIVSIDTSTIGVNHHNNGGHNNNNNNNNGGYCSKRSLSSSCSSSWSSFSLCSSMPSSTSVSSSSSSTSLPHVDVNNNNNNNRSMMVNRDPQHGTVWKCWRSLANDNLPDIMTRLIGHVHHILVGKSKKRLKKLKLWQDYFKDFYDKQSIVDTNVNLQEVYNRYSVDGDMEQVSHGHEYDNDEDDDSGLLDFDPSLLNSGPESSNSPSSTPSGTDKDSGLDESVGDSDENGSSNSDDILTHDEEEELFTVMRSILDKCLTHEAFWPHQPLYDQWREQLQCMIDALRNMMNDSAIQLHRTTSPLAARHSPECSFYSDRFSSRSPTQQHLQHSHLNSPHHHHQTRCHSPNGLNKHKMLMMATTATTQPSIMQSKKVSTLGYPKTSLSSNYNGTSTIGGNNRNRLLHNRSTTINHGAMTGVVSATANHGSLANTLDNGTVATVTNLSANCTTRNGYQFANSVSLLSPLEEKVNGKSQPFNPHLKSSNVASNVNNITVIPNRSTNLFSTPLNFNSNHGTTSSTFGVGNSPEANLRNLLLQQLIQQQQQHHQQQAMQSSHHAKLIDSFDYDGGIIGPQPQFTFPSFRLNTSSSSSLSSSSSSSSSSTTAEASTSIINCTIPFDGTEDRDVPQSCKQSIESMTNEIQLKQSFDSLPNGSPNVWSSNDIIDNIIEDQNHYHCNESSKIDSTTSLPQQLQQQQQPADKWNATNLLSTIDFGNNGKLENVLNQFDNNNIDGFRLGWSPMMMMMGHNGCPMTTMGETVTFHDDMEQLCIRMAEHALEINDESIYS